MNRHDLRNALCCLRFIDMHQLVEAGVIDDGDGKAWQRFSSNPEAFYLRCDDDRQQKLWGLIERQMVVA
jgi:hypothetical protein